MSEIRKIDRLTCLAVHVIAFGLAMSLVPLFIHINCLFEYRRGLGVQNWSPVPLLYPVEWGIIPAVYFCIQLGVFAILGSSRIWNLSWRIFLAAVIAFIFGIFIFFSFGPRPSHCFFEGFQKNAKSKIAVEDIEALRESLMALKGDGQPFRELHGKEKPKLIDGIANNWSPSAIIYFNTNSTPAYLVINWGGAFERYGIFFALDGRSPYGDKDFNFITWSKDVYFFIGG